MNPFQKLRRAVDKASLNYQIDNPILAKKPQHSPSEAENLKKTAPRMNENQASPKLGPTFLEQQTKYIQQINQLVLKNERLARSLKLAEVEKQQYLQQVCALEKDNQSLEEKIRELHEENVEIGEKERKYQEEIYRINKTVEMLGKEINEERNMKKSIAGQFARLKEEAAAAHQRDGKIREELQGRIKRLQEELRERSGLLEYNILKNSEDRKQSRIAFEKTQSMHDDRIQELNCTVASLKDQIAILKTNLEVLIHKHSIALEKYEEIKTLNSQSALELSDLRTKNQQLEANLRVCSRSVQQLQSENSKLEASLKEAKQNVRVKVVEIKDESLQLELQMYKRQCKDLLQQRAVMQKMSERTVYQIVE